MPAFVLLHHECPTGLPRPTHWDLMLETAGELRTWVLQELPRGWRPAVDPAARANTAAGPAQVPVPAEEIQPHRLDYLDLEGPLADGLGSVSRVDRGMYEPLIEAPCHVRVRLAGELLRGTLDLVRDHAETADWRLNFLAESSGRA